MSSDITEAKKSDARSFPKEFGSSNGISSQHCHADLQCFQYQPQDLQTKEGCNVIADRIIDVIFGDK